MVVWQSFWINVTSPIRKPRANIVRILTRLLYANTEHIKLQNPRIRKEAKEKHAAPSSSLYQRRKEKKRKEKEKKQSKKNPIHVHASTYTYTYYIYHVFELFSIQVKIAIWNLHFTTKVILRPSWNSHRWYCVRLRVLTDAVVDT